MHVRAAMRLEHSGSLDLQHANILQLVMKISKDWSRGAEAALLKKQNKNP